jgi:hypothetical protein
MRGLRLPYAAALPQAHGRGAGPRTAVTGLTVRAPAGPGAASACAGAHDAAAEPHGGARGHLHATMTQQASARKCGQGWSGATLNTLPSVS